MKVAIVGLGLIGGSLAKDLKNLKLASQITGVESNLENAKRALELGLVNKIQNFDEAIGESDLVILSVPVNAISQLLTSCLNKMKASAVVIDMGSTKEEICRSVSTHPKRDQYVASHPMAGTENSGPEAAVSGLFVNKTVVICEPSKSSESSLKTIRSIYETLKMRIVIMEPAEHDLHAAYVSHLSHISSFVLANTVLNKEKNTGAIFDLAGGGFESTVRLDKSSPHTWAPIFEQNKTYVSQALSDYIDHLKAFKEAIENKDKEKSKTLMSEANKIRRVLGKIAERLK
jgi:prephenate dehydrogenase